jgi:hypothetical protein
VPFLIPACRGGRPLRAVCVLVWAGTAETRRTLKALAGSTRAGGVAEDARQVLI